MVPERLAMRPATNPLRGKSEKGDQEPHEARDPALGAATEPQSREDGSHDGADYTAQDQAGPERREPAEDDAGPARAYFFFPVVPPAHTILLK